MGFSFTSVASREKRGWAVRFAIWLLATAASAASLFFGFFDTWQENITDRFFIGRQAPPEIVILAIDDLSIGEIGQWPWPRSVFATAVRGLQSARVIGIDVGFFEASRFGPADDEAFARSLTASRVPVVLPVELHLKTKQAVRPLDAFAGPSRQGFTNLFLDRDGAARIASTAIGGFDGFGALTAKLSAAEAPALPESVRIDYRGPARTFATVPIADVIAGRVPERILEDKIVLIGATASDLHDTVQTPFGSIPGVEAHANIIATLRSGAYVREAPFAFAALLIGLADALAILLIRKASRLAFLLAGLGGIFVAIHALAFAAFEARMILPNLYVSIAFFLSAGPAVAFQYLAESREKQFIRKTFQYYLAPEVISEILADPAKARLGGARRNITVLFSDIRGFTAMSELMRPEELTHLLNEYLSAMTELITARRGLVDKYIGDAIMAFWGAPLDNPRHAADACRAALEMLERLKALNEHWASRGLPRLAMGVGINTGEVFVGNAGSNERFNYTAIGDEVNFASRLEGLNKSYGTSVIIGESTRNAVVPLASCAIRDLDRIVVKGKTEPRRIFELLPAAPDAAFQSALDHFSAGRRLYAAGEWDRAIAEFMRALAIRDDGPSRLFLERCRELKAHPPAAWSGVFEFKTK